MTINNRFDIGDLVFLITDSEQIKRMVTAIRVTSDSLLYTLTEGINESFHYDIEISTERNVLLELGVK